jgi:membrane associated rhomboid family serine protease
MPVQLRITETVKRLLIVYGVVFVLQHSIDRFFGGHLGSWFALIPNSVFSGAIWQLFTYGFLHAGVMHLVLNLLILAFIASDIESVWGRKKLLVYYFFCVTLAGVFYLFTQALLDNPHYLSRPMVGASGGIYGLLLAYGVLFPNNQMLMMMVFPMRARQFVWVLAAIEFLQAAFSGQGGLSAIAHLSGMGAGYLFLRLESRGFRFTGRGQGLRSPKRSSHLRLVKGSEAEEDDSKGPKTWH